MSTSTSQSLSSEIDRLLEHYLVLLDQYTTLRTQLSSQQISIQQNLARAKFHAPPGVQYGESLYDGRMQAQRLLHINTTPTNRITFEIKKDSSTEAPTPKKDETTSAQAPLVDDENAAPSVENHEKKVPKTKDPIRMFGYSVPSTLKVAQVEAIKMVEGCIPQICAVNAEMLEVEIQIRRARKQRSKAEEREEKERLAVENGERGEVGVEVR